ncbi:DUF6183 family protein [Kitasatospora sp. NPDC002551]|uniref:DUF6183 family protein n=1 Tax=Kitasatospora sp. NPDC002551 TaxID=3154539 RepID=UPI00331940B9
MDDALSKILAKPLTSRNALKLERLARRRLKHGEVAFVADLGIGLARHHRSATEFDSLFDRLVRLLAVTPGAEPVGQLVRMLAAGRPDDPAFDRYVASMLAACRRPEDLTVVFDGGSGGVAVSDELRACLVHELVIRGVPVAEMPGIAGWATSPHWRDHPLGGLPLAPIAAEREPDLPHYSVDGSSHGLPYWDPEERHPAPRLDTRVPTAVETTTAAATAAMAAAVADWSDDPEEPEGRVEARTFAFADPLEPDAVPGALVALGLDCLVDLGDLPGPGEETAFGMVAVEPAEVWQVLFAAASTGGAYAPGRYGAYGRLRAWRSLAALAGAPADASAGEVEEYVRGCAWYRFGAATPWFHRVVWDLGVLAVAPDRRRLAVLAATTTD